MAGYWDAIERWARLLAAVLSPSFVADGIKRVRALGLQQDDGLTEANIRMLVRTVPDAKVFWVAAPLCDLLQVAATSLPDWTFRPKDLIAPVGFCWLEKPLVLHGSLAPIRALFWAEGIWRERLGPTRMAWRKWEEIKNEIEPVLWDYRFFGSEDEMWTAAYRWFTDKPLQTVIQERGVKWPDESKQDLALLPALLILLKEEITTRTRMVAPRFARRRLPMVAQEKHIEVVTLRRVQPTQSGTTPSPRDWAYQWAVSGHWRQQFYRSTNDHRPRWIAPYVKGPKDKPFRAPRFKVFAVVR